MTELIGGDSATPAFFPLTASTMALVSTMTASNGAGPFWHEDITNAMIKSADINAGITTGTAVTPGGEGTLAVTVAPDPTL